METKLTIIKWESGVPLEEGRYLVQIYSGAVDVDYYDKRNWWHKYHIGHIIRYSKLSELEDELNRVTEL